MSAPEADVASATYLSAFCLIRPSASLNSVSSDRKSSRSSALKNAVPHVRHVRPLRKYWISSWLVLKNRRPDFTVLKTCLGSIALHTVTLLHRLQNICVPPRMARGIRIVYFFRTSAMTNHHLLLACFLPAKRISRKHDRSPEGMVIWSIGSLALFILVEVQNDRQEFPAR